MKLAIATQRKGKSALTGEVLSEAMPWIKEITGKTVVIKYGGAALVDSELRKSVLSDILMLKMLGVKPVIVHGGGSAMNDQLRKRNFPVEFIDGQRVTHEESLDFVREVMTGEINQQLVWEMNQHGNIAVGISGIDGGVIVAEPGDPRLKKTGRITRINEGLISGLVEDNYIPVVAAIAIGEDNGVFNVNASLAAGHIASAIGAHKLVFISDVDGLYKNKDNSDSRIANMNKQEAINLLADKCNTTGGSIPKLQSCIHALDMGVYSVHVLNGKIPHVMLVEFLTDEGIGTSISNLGDPETGGRALVNDFASRLIENRCR